MRISQKLVLGIAAALTVPSLASATIINIDFNGIRGAESTAGTYSGAGAFGGGNTFNGLTADSTGSNGDNLTVAGSALNDDGGAATIAAFTVSPVGGDNAGGGGATALTSDYVFNNSAGNGSKTSPFTFSGLTGTTANIFLYSSANAAANSFGTINGSNGTLTTLNGFTGTEFTNVPIVGGSISGDFGSSTESGPAVIAGISIQTSVPEPASLGLLSLGGLSLLARRRQD